MKSTLLFSIGIFLSSLAMAQLRQEKNPDLHPSIEYNLEEISIDESYVQELLLAQERSRKNGGMFPVGTLVPFEVDLSSRAKWSIDNDKLIGKMKIQAQGATGLGVYFSEFFLPLGCKLYVYNEDRSKLMGPFTFDDNRKDLGFSTGTIEGEHLILEIVQPLTTQSKVKLMTSHLGYQLDPDALDGSRDFGDSDDCQINVACDEGDNWRDQQKSVVRIKMRIANFEGWCTGTVMNNTLQDCTPYILTADHCRHIDGGTTTSESDYHDWEFYFNYESNNCRNPNNEGQVTVSKMTGCEYKASSARGGDGDSDFLLVELDNSIPSFHDAFFAGWDRRGNASSSGVMIHHPAGDIKKISTYTRAAESSEWDANLARDTHWKIYWSSTSNGFGASEGGSSGSALWDQNGRVIGQLTGGSSACDQGSGVGPFNPDYFGKMSFNWYWDIDSSKNLEVWLDYGRSRLGFIDGISWPCSEQALSTAEVESSEEPFLYPNPTSDWVNIDLQKSNSASLKVWNALGEVVLEKELEQSLKLPVAEWQAGVYWFSLDLNGSIRTQKLMINE